MTALKTYDAKSFLALGGATEDMQAAMDAVGETEDFGPGDLTRVSMPTGGATVWTVPTIAGETNPKSIDGVLCHVARRGTLWPNERPVEGSQPVLVSHDLLTAEQAGPIPDHMIDVLERHRIDERHFDWAGLPYNQFGSKSNGSGKLCCEQRLLFVLRQGDLYPLVVTASPGSLRAVKQFLLGVPQAVGKPYWHCVVSLSLEKAVSRGGDAYARLTLKLVGQLSDEDAATVKARYHDPLSRMADRVDVAAE